MTPLTKAVSRKSAGIGPNRRRYVITIMPADTIGFRDIRSPKTYYLPLSYCYEQAIKSHVALLKKAKKAKRK